MHSGCVALHHDGIGSSTTSRTYFVSMEVLLVVIGTTTSSTVGRHHAVSPYAGGRAIRLLVVLLVLEYYSTYIMMNACNAVHATQCI